MPAVCPVDLDTARLRDEIRTIYSNVASAPAGEFHFHRGPEYAASRLGYLPGELASLPAEVTASFAGIGNPLAMGPLTEGATVVDIGCGSGTDLLLAARQVGPRGRAIGVDMTEAMRSRALEGARQAGLAHVEVREGDATRLPVSDEAADAVISNGVLNLVPDKTRAIDEIARVLKPGGRLQLADIALDTALSEAALRDVDLWAG